MHLNSIVSWVGVPNNGSNLLGNYRFIVSHSGGSLTTNFTASPYEEADIIVILNGVLTSGSVTSVVFNDGAGTGNGGTLDVTFSAGSTISGNPVTAIDLDDWGV